MLKVDYPSAYSEEINADICLKCGVCCVVNDYFCHVQFDKQFDQKNTYVYDCLKQENPIENPNIWLCVSCHKCEETCPYEVSPIEFIEMIKQEAFAKGYAHQGVMEEVEQVLTSGYAFPINPRVIRSREKMGLEQLIENKSNEIQIIANKTGLIEKLKKAKEEYC